MIDIKINSETIKDIDLFVFDKDGTLMDLYTYWHRMVELRAQNICSFYKLDGTVHKNKLMFRMGVDLDNQRLRPEGPVGLLPRAVVQKAAQDYLSTLNIVDSHDDCFRIFKEVDEESLPMLKEIIRPIEGVHELFRQIEEKGSKVAIATSDKTQRAHLAMDFLGLSDSIDIIVGSDIVDNPKPHAQTLELICEKTKVLPTNAVMVGDSGADISMGKNADFKASIGVCSGLTREDELRKLTPYVVSDITQIKIC